MVVSQKTKDLILDPLGNCTHLSFGLLNFRETLLPETNFIVINDSTYIVVCLHIPIIRGCTATRIRFRVTLGS